MPGPHPPRVASRTTIAGQLRLAARLTLGLLLLWSAAGHSQKLASLDLSELSLEELMSVEVTLASRKEEPLFATPAAIAILTREDIRRAGATSLPEALRLVPGVQVARVDANKWAVSARGFNGRFANRLLVLVDGRSVYSPLFSGVFWEVQDLVLEDVERIEVIRGPGAALWGANAVNGIIDIVTRPAPDTQGGLAILGLGSEEQGFLTLRYGGKLGTAAWYRADVKAFSRDAFVDAAGARTADDWSMRRASFRADWEPGRRDRVSLQGALYTGQIGQTYRLPDPAPPYRRILDDDTRRQGDHLLACWKRTLSPAADLRLQLYYDHTDWADTLLGEVRHTYDLDFQHHFTRGERHEIVWGLGYRYSADQTTGSTVASFVPADRGLYLASAFLQDEIALAADRLQLTLGAKFERNTYTGFDTQPSARLRWTPRPEHTLWAALSRALRTPSRSDADVRLLFQVFPPDSLFLGSPATLARVTGSGRQTKDENLLACELGYRVRPVRTLFLDLATFYNEYRNQRVSRPGLPFREDDHLVLPAPVVYQLEGETYGLEMAAEWELPARQGRLRAAYAWLEIVQRGIPEIPDLSRWAEGESPHHQFYLWPSLHPHPALHLDSALRYVDPLPSPGIDRYLELDLRLAWRPYPSLELALAGRNLLHARHPEFQALLIDTLPTQTQRSGHATLTWGF